MDAKPRTLGFAVDGDGVLSLSNALTVTSTVSVVVAVSDRDYRSLRPSRLTVVIRTGGTAEWAAISAAVAVGATVGTEVASLVLRDYSAVVVETELDGLFGFGGNVLSLSVSAATVGAYLATAVVSDGEHSRVGTVTLVYTLSVVSGVTVVDPLDPEVRPPTDSGAPSASDRLVTVAPTFSGDLLTVSLVGGLRPYGYALADAVSGYGVDVTAGVLSVSVGGAPLAGTTATMTVRGSDSLGSSADATVRVVGATDIVVEALPLLYSPLNETPRLATLSVSGGVGDYRYGVSPSTVFRITQKGRLWVGTAQTEVGDVTATISVSDEARGRVAVTVLATVRFYDGLVFAENPVSVAVAADYTGPVHAVSVLGGSGDYGYSVALTVGGDFEFTVDAGGVLSLSSPLVDRVTVSVVVEVLDSDSSLSPASLTVVVRTGGTAEWRTISASVLVGAAVGTEVASLVLRDYSAVVVETELDGLFGFGGNVLTLSSSAAAAGAYLATAVVSDGAHPLVGTVTLVYTLSVVSVVTAVDPLDPEAPSGSNRLVTVAPTFSGELLTVSLVGGALPYGYSLSEAVSGYGVDATVGVLSVSVGGAPEAGTTATMTVVGTGRLGSSAEVTVRVVGATDIVVGAVPLLYAGVGETATLVTLEVSGGVAPYGYVVSSSVFGVSDEGVFEVVTARTETGYVTATVSVSDEARGRVAVAVSLSVRFVEGVGVDETAVSVVVGHDYTGELHSVVASGGSGEYGYALVQTVDSLDRGLGFAVDDTGVLSLSDALTVTSTVSVVVAVSDARYRSLVPSRLTVVVRTGGSAEWAVINGTVAVGAPAGTELASLVLRGYTTVTVETVIDDLFGFGGNSLTLAESVAATGAYLATAVVGDSAHSRVGTVTLVYTLSVVERVTVVDPANPDRRDPEDSDRLFGSERLVTVAPSFFGDLLTVSLVGGVSPYGYALAEAVPGYAVDATAGVLSVSVGGAPSAGATATVTVRGTDSLGSSADATVRVVGAPDITVTPLPFLYSPLNERPILATLTVTGGVGDYSYGVSPTVFGINREGRLRVRERQTETGDVTATLSVSDEARGRVAVTVLATVRFGALPLAAPAASYHLVSREEALPLSLTMLTPVGGFSPFVWSKVAGTDADGRVTVLADGRVSVVSVPTTDATLVVTVAVAEDGTGRATTSLTIEFYAPISLSLRMTPYLLVTVGMTGTVAVVDVYDGAGGSRFAYGYTVTTTSEGGQYGDYFGTTFVTGTTGSTAGRRVRPVEVALTTALTHYFEAAVSMTVTDATTRHVRMTVLTIRSAAAAPLSLVKPLGTRTLEPGEWSDYAMAVLGEHFGGGLPPYRYTVTAAAGGVSVVTGGVLAYSGTGRVATALTATVRAYDYEGHTVTTAVTLEFASTVSFAAATVTQTVAADFVGAVFALSATNGSGRFSYSVVTPVYRADGRTITVSLAGGGTVALGEGLAVGERLTMTATATDENPILGGATMGLVLEAAEAAVSLSVLFAELRLNEGNRAVASLRIAGYPRPTVSLSDAGAFDYLPLAVARDGGWLRARVFDYEDTRAVTMTVADRGLGWPVLEVAHTVRWVGNRFIFNVQSRRVWRSADGEQWTQQCEDCFALRQLNHSAISYKGSLWVIGGVKFGSSDNSEDDSHFYVSGDDGVTWVTVRQEPPLPKSFVELAVHGGTLWAVGGANDKTDEHFTPLNAVHYYSEDAGQFVLATDSPPFDGRYLHFLTSFKGTMLLIAGRTYDGPGEDVLSPEIWASTDGFAWRLATATAAFGPRNGGELVRHKGRLYLYSARHSAPTDLSAIWVSDDGVNWSADYALPADLKATNTNRYEMVSHAGSLFIGGVYRGTDVNLNEVWRSADGGNWTLVTVSANFDREVSEWVVHDSSSENPTPPSSIVLSGLKPVYPVSTEEVAPVTIATLSLSGGWGDYVLDFVEEGGIFTIGREGDALFVTVTSVGAAGTEATATLRVTDATPDNAVTAEILVRFYASLSFGDASLVTHTVAADFVGEVYAPAATGGNGFSYSVFAPAYRADGGTVSVSISARQRVAVGAPLAVGERLTMTVVAGETTAHEEGRATMTLVLAAVEAVASLTVWYAQLPVSEGHRAVASLRIAGYTEATVSLASGDDFRFLPETGGGGLLRVGAATAEEEWRATLAVANRSLGWPVVSITHTVAWFGSRGLYLVGGSYEGAVETDRPPSDEEEPLSEVWSSADGGVWTGRCETGCFARGQLSHSAASYGGSLWVIGGKQDDHFYRSRDGMEWLTVAINGDSGLPRNYYGHRAVSHGGSLWVVGGGVAGDLVSDVRVYSETAGRFVLVSAGTPPPASEGHEVVSFDGRMWFFGGTTGVWTSFDGADWTTVGAALPTSGEASHVVHGGRIYHYDGSAVWSSADGRGWTAAGSAPTGGARTGDYLVSYEGSLWIVGGSPVERAIWRSADGGSWDLVTEAPAFGAASGAELVVHEVVPETGPRTGISVQGLASLYAVSTEETTPLAIATLTVVSAAGGYRMTQVEGGETVTAGLVGDRVFVTVTRVGEAETVVTALLRVGDATPENLLTVAVLVSFYAPVRFVPSLVTHTVAAGFVGAMFAPSGLGGSGEFDYSVFSPAYRADGEAVAASVAGGGGCFDAEFGGGGAVDDDGCGEGGDGVLCCVEGFVDFGVGCGGGGGDAGDGLVSAVSGGGWESGGGECAGLGVYGDDGGGLWGAVWLCAGGGAEFGGGAAGGGGVFGGGAGGDGGGGESELGVADGDGASYGELVREPGDVCGGRA